MVMACVALDSRGAALLTRRGVRDSKMYGASAAARQTRAELAALVREVAVHVSVDVIDVDVIDRRVWKNELEVLEREVAAMLLDRAPPAHRVIADGERRVGALTAQYANLVAWNKAESRHASVAAASVVAKHRRDDIFERICGRYRPLFGEVRGGGYGNEATRRFLRAYAGRFGRLPPEARRSWQYEYLRDLLGAEIDRMAAAAEAAADAAQGGPQLQLF
jgi:ribonuclease HII